MEGLRVIKGTMAEGRFSFSGEHYRVTDYDGLPKPVQRPCPPVLIGGGGKRVLSIAAREADIVGINGTLTAGVIGVEAVSTMTAAEVDKKVAIVAEAGAHRLADIEMNIRTFFVKVTDDRRGTVDAIAGMFGIPAEFVEESPFALIGSVDSVIETILAARERWGFSYFIVGGENIEEIAPVVAALKGK